MAKWAGSFGGPGRIAKKKKKGPSDLEKFQEQEVQKEGRLEEEKQKQPKKVKEGLIEKTGGLIKRIPLLKEPFKLHGKITTGIADKLGIGTPEQREQAKEWWGGNITAGEVIGTAALVGGGAAAVAIRGSRLAFPTAARIWPNAFKGAGKTPKGSLIKKWIDVDAKVLRTKFGITDRQATGLARELGRRRVSEIANIITKQKGSLLSLKGVGGLGFKRMGASMMVGWLGADTLSQGASIQARDIAQDLRFGNTTPEQANADLDTLEGYTSVAKGAVLASIAISPVMTPISLMFLASTNLAQNQINSARRLANRG